MVITPGGATASHVSLNLGGLGIVNVAHDAELNREVALKEIQFKTGMGQLDGQPGCESQCCPRSRRPRAT